MISEKMQTCAKCSAEMGGTFEYCPKCGERRMSIRSENEIKMEREKIRAVNVTSVPGLVLSVSLDMAFNWVLGSKSSPITLLEALEKKKDADKPEPK